MGSNPDRNSLGSNNGNKPQDRSTKVMMAMGIGLIWGVVFQSFAIGFLFMISYATLSGVFRKQQ